MTSPVITMANLSKAYRIGLAEKVPDTITEAALAWIKAPLRKWRRLRRLNTFAPVIRSQSSVGGNSSTHGNENGQAGLSDPRALGTPHSGLRTPHSGDLIWALRGVSLDVREGEVVGIIGRNGAGKSTLLKILSRITEPTSGRAWIRGRVSSLLEVGTGFHPELTGRENIYMNGTILGMTKREIDRKFDEIVDFSGVETFLDTPLKRYSSGMQVRLAFSVAAHLEPEILIIDEVLAVGDTEFQSKCLGKMQEVSRCGRTVLFVSHNMAAVQQLCTRAVLLDAGSIVEDGTPRDVLGSYLSRAGRQPVVALRDWSERVTNGEARIIELRLSDERGKQVHTIPVNGGIRFTIVAEFKAPLRNPMFGVLVHSSSGQPLLDIQSKHSSFYLERAEGTVEVDALVERIGLYPGDYLLSPWIENRCTKSTVDWVMYGAQLRVQSVANCRRNLKLDPQFGQYYVESKWQPHVQEPSRRGSDRAHATYA